MNLGRQGEKHQGPQEAKEEAQQCGIAGRITGHASSKRAQRQLIHQLDEQPCMHLRMHFPTSIQRSSSGTNVAEGSLCVRKEFKLMVSVEAQLF